MSIFGTIMSKIFGHAEISGSATPAGTQPATVPVPGAAPAPTSAASATPSAAPAATATPVDVEAILNGLSSKHPEKLDWRHSIVDLMKLLDLDSSLSARKGLAQELHYTGDMNDSASMNIWLHRQVMQKLAENGGKVPADLKS